MRHLAVTLAALVVLALPGAGLAKKSKDKAPSGDKLFAQNCAYCHGNGGKGDGPNAERLKPPPSDLTKSAADESEIANVVKNGKGSCPSWRASFAEDEVSAVARFTKSLQH